MKTPSKVQSAFVLLIAATLLIGADAYEGHAKTRDILKNQADATEYRKRVSIWHDDEEKMLRSLCVKMHLDVPPAAPVELPSTAQTLMPLDHDQTEAVIRWLERISIQQGDILKYLRGLKAQEKTTMATIADLASAVAAEKTVEASLLTYVTGIQSQLAAALANTGTTIPPEVQAAIDSTFAAITSDNATLAAAVPANTPVATPPAATPSTGSGTDTDTTVTGSGTDSTAGSAAAAPVNQAAQ